MGMVYELSWAAKTGHTAPCDEDTHIFKIENDGTPEAMSWEGAITKQKVVVLPTSADEADCTLNDKDSTKIKANADAFKAEVLAPCPTGSTCWTVDTSSITLYTTQTPKPTEGTWIEKKSDGSYVYYHVAGG